MIELHVSNETMFISEIYVAPFLDKLESSYKSFFLAHGMELEGNCLKLPSGTIRHTIYPVIISDRYQVTLPDGLVFQAQTPCSGKNSLLSFNQEDLPQDLKSALENIK